MTAERKGSISKSQSKRLAAQRKGEAFVKIMGDPTMPRNRDDPDYDEWLFDKSWRAAWEQATERAARVAEPYRVNPVRAGERAFYTGCEIAARIRGE